MMNRMGPPSYKWTVAVFVGFLVLAGFWMAGEIASQPDEPPVEEEVEDSSENSPADGETETAETEEAAEDPSDEGILDVIYKGGWTMAGLGLMSTLILAFAFERFFYFRKAKVSTKNFYDELDSKLQSGGLEAARAFLAESDLLIARTLRNGLASGAEGYEAIEKAIERNAQVEIGNLERGLNLLANLGNLAPLLGFFGTVVGMRESFRQFVFADVATAQQLAGGVEKALVTTAAGLLIAIPAYLIYNLFIYVIDNFTREVERSTGAILARVEEPSAKAPRKTPPARKSSGAASD